MLLELFWVRLLGRTVAVLVVLCIFGLPLAWFGLTLFILRQEKHNRVISSQEEMAGLRRVMPCPGCKSDMELGRTRHPFGMVLFQDFTPPCQVQFLQGVAQHPVVSPISRESSLEMPPLWNPGCELRLYAGGLVSRMAVSLSFRSHHTGARSSYNPGIFPTAVPWLAA